VTGMHSEKGRKPVRDETTLAALCPNCLDVITLNGKTEVLHKLVRCPNCEMKLHVVSIRPLSFRTFKSHGLSFVDG